jgi:hypothetical protein
MTTHRAPLEPTSDRVPCCGALLADLDIVTDPITRHDRDVTCKPDELSDLGMNPVLAAVVDAIRGPRRDPLIARLREIKASTPVLADVDASEEIPHGEPGHDCIPPEVLMQVQDSLNNVLRIVEGHKNRLEEAGYPEAIIFPMIANLHATLLSRML